MADARDSSSRIDASPPLGAKTVLLVEDDEQVRLFMVQALETHGYAVLPARNGREALDVARRRGGAIDVLVTDVVMPEISGPELAGELGRKNPGLGVLYVSGYTGVAGLRCPWIGPETPFLEKPFEAEHLTRRVDEILAGA